MQVLAFISMEGSDSGAVVGWSFGEGQGWDPRVGRRWEFCIDDGWIAELIVLMLKFNCSINHVPEHQEPCEGVCLVTISAEGSKLNNDVI